MRAAILLPLSLFLFPVVFACEALTDGVVITESMALCSDTFDIPNGITITGSGIVFDCGTAVLRGILGQSEIGIRIENAQNVTVRECNVVTFNQGLYLKNVTFSHIVDNAFLKNRIGIRMLDAFENVLEKNADKSHQLAVSAINSKYNIVMLDNKNIERGFCEENACNRFVEMDVCESGDFYCSPRCAPERDSDCGPAKQKATGEQPPAKEEEPIALELESAVGVTETTAAVSVSQNESVERPDARVVRELSLVGKGGIYLLLYLVALAGLWVFRR